MLPVVPSSSPASSSASLPVHAVFSARCSVACVTRPQVTRPHGLIRAATLDDAELLARTIRVAFSEYAGLLDPPSLALSETAASVRQVLAQGGAFVAERRGRVMGCVLYSGRGDHLYFSRLSVLPGFRGVGLARALTGVVEQRALACGLGCVRLSVRRVLHANRSMYRKFGYRHFGFGVAAGCPGEASEMLEKHLASACLGRPGR